MNNFFIFFETWLLQKLTAGPSSPYVLYTYFSCLSQILFEWEQLAEFPVDDFLPWHSPKPGFGGKVKYHFGLILAKFFLFSLNFRNFFFGTGRAQYKCPLFDTTDTQEKPIFFM